MENFNWTSFTRRIVIRSTIEKLYDAWTVPAEIESWFLSETTYRNPSGAILDRNTNVSKNDLYEWHWFFYEGVEHGSILNANGKDQLQFNFAKNCLVEVNLKQLENKVLVELTQSNIPTDNESKEQIRLGCEGGWAFYLVNLKSIYEGGIDLRNKDTDMSVFQK